MPISMIIVKRWSGIATNSCELVDPFRLMGKKIGSRLELTREVLLTSFSLCLPQTLGI